MGEVVDDAVREEVRGDGVPPKTAHVGPQDAQHLVQKLLDEGGEAADLPDIAALPDEEEVEGAEVLVNLSPGDERARADVDAERFVGAGGEEIGRGPTLPHPQVSFVLAGQKVNLFHGEHEFSLL